MKRDWVTILAQGKDFVDSETFSYGIPPTLRRLHYLLVSDAAARDAGYVNTENDYKQLSSRSGVARRAGTFPDLVDRTRSISYARGYSSPSALLLMAANGYNVDRSKLLDPRVLILVEKDGVIPLIESRFDWLDVAAVRGYSSVSFLSELNRRGEDNQVALYIGDHDPTGLDIAREIAERLEYPIQRIALNRDQVDEYQLPPMAAKATDTRYAAMVAKEGEAMQVELDAMPAEVLLNLVAHEITRATGTVIRPDGQPNWPDVDESEKADRARLMELAGTWTDSGAP